MITCQGYSVADPAALETPAMLLFQDMMDHNLRSVCEMVGGGRVGSAHSEHDRTRPGHALHFGCVDRLSTQGIGIAET